MHCNLRQYMEIDNTANEENTFIHERKDELLNSLIPTMQIN